MAKRRAAPADSDSESDQPQPPKRARTNGHSQGPAVPRASGSRTANRGADNDEPLEIEDEEEVDQAAPDAEQEKEFEEQHEDDIREKIMNTNKTTGVRDTRVSVFRYLSLLKILGVEHSGDGYH